MRTFHENRPNFIPKLWDILEVFFEGHSVPFYGRVIQSSGSTAKGKISILCKSGPKAKSFSLIWKQNLKVWENNNIWHCWIDGQHYTCEKVKEYNSILPDNLKEYLTR